MFCVPLVFNDTVYQVEGHRLNNIFQLTVPVCSRKVKTASKVYEGYMYEVAAISISVYMWVGYFH